VSESQNQPFQLSFNRFLRVDFQGSRVTSDAGLLVVRELDERLDLTGVNGTPSSGEGRVSRRGAISPCGLHRHQPGAAEPGGRAVLQ